MNIQGLIERYEKFKDSKKKLTSVDLVLKDLRSLDEPEPLPFKLKDVVRRIRGFDPMTQARWLNGILKELGDDYGSMKYREGYEQGKFDGEWVGNQLKDADKIRRELNKPVIPQFVADWIEVAKPVYSLSGGMTYGGPGVNKWLAIDDNQEIFALAWILGYEVEKEKRYLVRIKGVEEDNAFLNYYVPRNEWFLDSACDMGDIHAFHTRKKLEEAGFGEVFNSPLFEVLEVE
ncbi:DUF1642 domain-containing protein [uncultured Streptococcus sp.]|uniref:DUF1642 domain-containing protein n=1 Tax=uncultured Streptococcus sp. TaxID=83427 RepID=UPI0025E9527F|nr:DUF1642 domain-containing protein [uncultured Streptococcus sp.]MDU1740135.1 DUF1642 domain-containing protein [Streptococcus mitis]